MLQHADQVVDIFLEAEAPLHERDLARILPVGDVDIVVLQHGLHRVAQECREVTGKGSDDQHFRLWRVDVLAEMEHAAKREIEHCLLDNKRLAILDNHGRDAEGL